MRGEQMLTEYGKIEENIVITQEIALHGMIVGNAIVKSGGILHLHGMVTKDLIVEKGGKVFLYGTVSGDTWNQGGELSISGTVVGRLIEQAGTTHVDQRAAIGTSEMRIQR
jgi:hypothetical protein